MTHHAPLSYKHSTDNTGGSHDPSLPSGSHALTLQAGLSSAFSSQGDTVTHMRMAGMTFASA
ncbi:hypothetical protein [Caballeronia sp. LZ035]|uniref:hypothetical protein n=1 Tax=Caballeronia sp. LZ035 TaxID=3038568 RepID=UPI00285A9B31|nr:hypothetical protein [Caballeronia sp. LZ035]MDR5760965.1 hypothetical protein [Caballeronia sp. LZ035]